jgi:hypothetical protein
MLPVMLVLPLPANLWFTAGRLAAAALAGRA